MNIVNAIYNRTIRPLLPHKIGVYNGVAVRGQARLLDRMDVNQGHKSGLIGCLVAAASSGETIVEIGSGKGVATVRAAQAVGPDGEVYTYDGSQTFLSRARDTVTLNQVDGRVTLTHGFVGTGETVWGDADDAARIALADLPDAEGLVLDCEGAETQILGDLRESAWRPEWIVVECHAFADAPAGKVQGLLEAAGYEVVDRATEGRGRSDREDDEVLLAEANG